MIVPKIFLKTINICLSFLIIASLFLIDMSAVLPNLQTQVSNLYAQNMGSNVKMYLSNPPSSLVPGTEFSLLIKLDSQQTTINAIQADISYPAGLLEITSVDTSASVFPLPVVNTSGNGSISVIRGSFTPVSGTGLTLAKINFKALLAGTAVLKFADSSAAVNSSVDSLTESPGLSLIINSPLPSPIVTPTSTPTALPSPFVSSTPISTPTPTPTPSQPAEAPGEGGQPLRQNSTITIYAAGTPAWGIYPDFKLEIKQMGSFAWKAVKTFSGVKGDPNKRIFQQLTYTQNSPILASDIRVRFINDWYNKWLGDRNLMVDRIVIDGAEIQTERSSTYSTGTWSVKNGCSNGNKSSEWLHCNGYFEYR